MEYVKSEQYFVKPLLYGFANLFAGYELYAAAFQSYVEYTIIVLHQSC